MGLSDDEIVYLLQQVDSENQQEKVVPLLQRAAGKDKKEKIALLIQQLQKRIAKKDKKALAVIFKAYHKYVYGFVKQRLWWLYENEDEKNEAAHEIRIRTFEALWKNPQGYDPGKNASLKTWLCGIAKNKVVDYYRGSRERPPGLELTELEETLADPGAIDPPEAVVIKSFLDALRECIQKLPEKMQETYKAFLEDMTAAEMAKELGIPEDTVKSRLRRGNELLKPCVEKRAGKWSWQ